MGSGGTTCFGMPRKELGYSFVSHHVMAFVAVRVRQPISNNPLNITTEMLITDRPGTVSTYLPVLIRPTWAERGVLRTNQMKPGGIDRTAESRWGDPAGQPRTDGRLPVNSSVEQVHDTSLASWAGNDPNVPSGGEMVRPSGNGTFVRGHACHCQDLT